MKFKIKHIFHSGFEIDFGDYIILIDVYNHLDQYKNKKIYCFSTHSHGDHFHPDMLKLQDHNDVKYIFSDDIKAKGEIIFVKEGDELVVDDLKIKVFGTTDLGVSYYIDVKDTLFFHSGDLNWWHWSENSKESQEDEKRQYQLEIQKLLGLKIDFAFVPVDFRLRDFNRLAMDYFIEKLNPKYLIPMHFGDHYESIEDIQTSSETKLLKSKGTNTYIF